MKPVARLQEEISDRPYSEGKKFFEIVILDRDRCKDDMLLYSVESFKDSLSALLTALQADIMNIPAKLPDSEFGLDHKARMLYKEGHRDARHAAVELVMAFAQRIEEGTK